MVNEYTDIRSDREKAFDYAIRLVGYGYDAMGIPKPVNIDEVITTADKILVFLEADEIKEN